SFGRQPTALQSMTSPAIQNMATAVEMAPIHSAGIGAATPELTLVVPTYNESANVPVLVERVAKVLGEAPWEIVFVDDDSPDGTSAAIRAISARDGRVRGIRRIGRRGLAGACIEGMLASQARFVAVMDADMQHDETILLSMLDRLREGDIDLVV